MTPRENDSKVSVFANNFDRVFEQSVNSLCATSFEYKWGQAN